MLRRMKTLAARCRLTLLVTPALLLLVSCSSDAHWSPLSGGAAGAAGNGGAGSGGAQAGGGAASAGAASGSAAGGAGNSGASAGGSSGAPSAAAAGAAGMAGAAGAAGGAGSPPFALTSSEHEEGATFADAFTCAGAGVSPALTWTPGPAGTKSYAITFFDTTLVSAGNANGYHWVLWDLPASTLALPGKLPSGATLTTPVSARQLSPDNPFDDLPKDTYFGPCPNAIGGSNNTDSYAFTLYALDVERLSGELNSVKNVAAAIEAAKPLASTKLSGTSSAKPD
jgi:Raf kinase inhibitor-like YbhB/YbcL family protein